MSDHQLEQIHDELLIGTMSHSHHNVTEPHAVHGEQFSCMAPIRLPLSPSLVLSPSCRKVGQPFLLSGWSIRPCAQIRVYKDTTRIQDCQ